MKNIIFFVFLNIICLTSFAQTSIVSGYGEASHSQSSMFISIGQTFFQSAETANVGGLYFGVQQSHELIIETLIGHQKLDFLLTVFPNPVVESLEIKCDSKNRLFSIVDANGVVLAKKTPLKATQKVSFSSFSSGIYFLVVESASQSIYTYKIIKK